MLPYITSFNTLNCHQCVSLPPSWYLHLSPTNHKYNHSPTMLALYSVNGFKMWLRLFISDAWISERPLICLFHYAPALCTAWACKDERVCRVRGSDVRFVKEQRCVTMKALKKYNNEEKKSSFGGLALSFAFVLKQNRAFHGVWMVECRYFQRRSRWVKLKKKVSDLLNAHNVTSFRIVFRLLFYIFNLCIKNVL